jgi:hypothetical protein
MITEGASVARSLRFAPSLRSFVPDPRVAVATLATSAAKLTRAQHGQLGQLPLGKVLRNGKGVRR